MIKNLEKSLKRFFKRKIKITLGLMVSFLMTGNFLYSEEYRYTGEKIEAGEYEEKFKGENHYISNLGKDEKEFLFEFKEGAEINSEDIVTIDSHGNNTITKIIVENGKELKISNEKVLEDGLAGTGVRAANGGQLEILGDGSDIIIEAKETGAYSGNIANSNIGNATLKIGTEKDNVRILSDKFGITVQTNSKGEIQGKDILIQGAGKVGAFVKDNSRLEIGSSNSEKVGIVGKIGLGVENKGEAQVKGKRIVIQGEEDKAAYTINSRLEIGDSSSEEVSLMGNTGLSASKGGTGRIEGNMLKVKGNNYGILSMSGGKNILTGDIVSIEGKTGLYSGEEGSEVTISKKDDIKKGGVLITSNSKGITTTNSGKTAINHDFLQIDSQGTGISTTKQGVLDIEAQKIVLNGTNYGVLSMSGGKNRLTGDLISIEGSTGIYSDNKTGEGSEVIINKDENEGRLQGGVLINSSTTGITTINSGKTAINHDFLQIDSEKIGINSVDNGKVTLNSSSTNIIAKDDGIRTGNHGSVTIDTTNKEKENKENSVLVSSDLRALTTATENADNGGKIDITSSSINLVGNKVKDENIYTGTNKMNLKVQSVVFGYNGEINLNGDINITSENNEEIEKDRIYAGVQSRGGSKINLNGKTYISSKDGVALYATDLRDIHGIEITDSDREKSEIVLSDVGNHTLLGDIIAGKNSTITIGGSGNHIVKSEDATNDIEILAANGGTVNLDLTGGKLVGRVDNYYEADEKGNKGDSTIDDEVFRNDKLYLEISSGGTIDMKMDKDTEWIAKGQSYVSSINYDVDKKVRSAESFGTIDLSTEEGTSINIGNLGSNGTFKVKLDSNLAHGDAGESDMLYIQNITYAGAEINVIAEGVLDLKPGEKLRFATIGKKTEDNYNSNVVFKVSEVTEEGIKDVSFTVGSEDYNPGDNDINSGYNGATTEDGKPGNEFVDKEYGDGTNHYLTKDEDTDKGGDSNVNDGGLTIIEMGKSTYANAVYMDNLNKRLGDMSFATGDEGIWVRMRNDRVGEDEHYRLHNYMTQLGYDKKYTMDNGDEHRGIAFEYGRGDLDFKQLNGGELKSDKYILTLYDTRVRNNGVYTDYTLRGGAIATDFTSYGRQTGNEVNGSYKNMLLGAGVEGGKRFDINKNWYFEPQAQLQYTFIDSTDYTTNQSTKVELDSIHSLIGRAGFRLGHDYYNENGKDNTIYVKADINHEFLGDQNIKAIDNTGSLDKTYKNDGTWYDIGIGGAKNITPDFNVYMDVEKQFGDNRDSNSWQFNVGFRYRFNELKDLNPVVMLRDFSLRADNYFDFDKSTLKPEGKKVIKKVSEELTKEKAKGTLKIEGHTDWTGTREYNQKLSERRAKSVEEELRKNITTDRIKYETVGYGEDRPIADNTTKEGRAKNRRVDIKFEGVGER